MSRLVLLAILLLALPVSAGGDSRLLGDRRGHGIGQQMHEPPTVLHYGIPGQGLVLEEGMTFTIEPMVNQGKARVKQKRDGWTVVTADKKLSAQWEHTVAVTANGFEVLTLRREENHA